MTSLTYFWQKAKYRVENLAVSKETDTKWNSSTNSGTVPQFEEPRTVSQKCGTAPQKVEQVLKSGHCSTNCGTAPAKSGTGTMNSTTKVTNGMLFQDVRITW